MLFNALIKPILEYCCTVWSNCSVENLQRLLQVQKRCARLILDATINDSSVELLDKLGWLPIDDITHARKLFMLHKVSQGHCPEYFSSYFKYVRRWKMHRVVAHFMCKLLEQRLAHSCRILAAPYMDSCKLLPAR